MSTIAEEMKRAADTLQERGIECAAEAAKTKGRARTQLLGQARAYNHFASFLLDILRQYPCECQARRALMPEEICENCGGYAT